MSAEPSAEPRPVPSAATSVDGPSALSMPRPLEEACRRTHLVPPAREGQEDAESIPPPPVRLLLRGLLEVLSGWRPAAQMALRVSPEIAADLLARPRRRGATPTPQLRRLRVLRVSDRTVETCAVVVRGRRCGALAMRMEFGSRGWLVTRLQVG